MHEFERMKLAIQELTTRVNGLEQDIKALAEHARALPEIKLSLETLNNRLFYIILVLLLMIAGQSWMTTRAITQSNIAIRAAGFSAEVKGSENR